MKFGSISKAIVSALAAGTAALATAMGDGLLEVGEGVTVALAILGALGITYTVPNAQQSDRM